MNDKQLKEKTKDIIIKGARVNNLKNLSVSIKRNKLVVITGLSGSGKSSLAFDTLYAEGQRRYVESLSSYARQFLGKMSKPEVDYIKGISPAIAIEQKVNSRNPRSTVGTSTEIYEYVKLLFARIGHTYSPISGKEVVRHKISNVVDAVMKLKQGSRCIITAPHKLFNGRKAEETLDILRQQGFSRMLHQGKLIPFEDFQPDDKKINSLDILIDRIIVDKDNEDLPPRLGDSVQQAFYEGKGECDVFVVENGSINETMHFSNRFELDGITFEEPSINLFSFNNPFGACKKCEGFGSIIGIDEDLVVPDKSLSIYEDAIACWRGEKMSEWKDQMIANAYKFDFPIHKAWHELSIAQKELLWTGNEFFSGLNDFFNYVESKSYKIQYRVMLSRYRGKTVCPECKGTRLRKDANYVKVGGKSVSEIVLMPVNKAREFFDHLQLPDHEQKIASRLLIEIKSRLGFLEDVGLSYLSLNRLSNTLSGGESQRINLATSLGSSLVGSMYILDEPSIGLHPKDTQRLIKVLKELRDLGNTVIVVEHDEEIIRAADDIIDIGPLAGNHGGELVAQGKPDEIIKNPDSLTAAYLSGRKKISKTHKTREWKDYIGISGAHENNLKNINVKFPLHVLNVVTGVSGSGKTSLVKKTLFAALKKIHGGYGEKTGQFNRLLGDYNKIEAVELVDQNPIGRSSRSNPATYVKAYDDIRQLFANQQLAKLRGYKPGFFSFNIEGGRCEACEGEGVVRIEMQFMADITLKCESCGGSRFKDEVLDVKYQEKNIADILNMTVNQALLFFADAHKPTALIKRIMARLKPLQDVGLGYLKLGQSSSTLSGGEAQRIKLAFFLGKNVSDKSTLFIFDEPTTGLHFHDIGKLLASINALIEKGHSVIVVEHNPDVIKNADWIIDLGPGGGDDGGEIVFEGRPEELPKCKKGFTASFVKI